MPTLIVWGDHDPIVPVRHAHTREDPDRFAQVLIDFMTSTEPAAVSTPQWQKLLLRHTLLRAAH